MGKLKRSHRIYMAWEYEQEIDDLNRKSEEGWQLVKGGCFYSVYEQDNRQIYRYQIDFHNGIENRMRYREMFEEQGWQYINSTYNGWHYFRKPYNPDLPAEEYEIYTEQSAIPDMVKRWQRLGLLLMAAIFLMMLRFLKLFVDCPDLPGIMLIVMYVCIFIWLCHGYFRIGRIRSGQKARQKGTRRIGRWIGLFIIIAAYAIGMILSTRRPSFKCKAEAEIYTIDNESGTIELGTLSVNYKDYYYMNLLLDNDPALVFELVDADGQIVYSRSDSHVDQENIQLSLSKGIYTIRFRNMEPGTEGRMRINCEIN